MSANLPHPDSDLYALFQLVGTIDGKMDRLLADSTDHEARLRVLESIQARRIGAAAAVSAVIGLAGGAAWNAISNFFKGH